MTVAVAIFVKTPGVSPLKTRLAKTVGQQAAEAFFSLSLKAIQETLQVEGITQYWAVAEEQALDNPLWESGARLHTGEGDLGERQHYVYETLLRTYDKVILIGADAPQLSAHDIQKAVDALEDNDFVIGPAHDGGYYLFGGRVSTEQEMWRGITWSVQTTKAELEARLPSCPSYLQVLTDVDTQNDLYKLVEEMPEHLNPAQKELLEWIEKTRIVQCVS